MVEFDWCWMLMLCSVQFNFDEDDLFLCNFLSLVVDLLWTIRLSDGATVNTSSAPLYVYGLHICARRSSSMCVLYSVCWFARGYSVAARRKPKRKCTINYDWQQMNHMCCDTLALLNRLPCTACWHLLMHVKLSRIFDWIISISNLIDCLKAAALITHPFHRSTTPLKPQNLFKMPKPNIIFDLSGFNRLPLHCWCVAVDVFRRKMKLSNSKKRSWPHRAFNL